MANRSPDISDTGGTGEKSRQTRLASANGHQSGANGSRLDLSSNSESLNGIDPPSAAAIYVAATFLLLGGYTAVFAITLQVSIFDALRTAFANVMPLSVLSFIFYRLLRNTILKQSVVFQASSHVVLAPLFATSWYALTLVGLAIVRLAQTGTLDLGRFSGVALVWQLFQGLVLYALVAATTYALRGGRAAAPVQLVEPGISLERYV